MNARKTIFQICGLTHHYPREERPALADFSLRVSEGERVAILGISGSGKTTVLNIVGLLEDIHSGSVVYCDAEGRAWEYHHANGKNNAESAQILPTSRRRDIRRQDFAFVMQDAHLWHYLSGLENSIESLILSGYAPTVARKTAAAELLPLFMFGGNGDSDPGDKRSDVECLMRKTSARLSGGQRTRMAIGRALVRRPRVLFLDEPNASSDPITASNNNRCIRACLDQSATTVFLVSHRYEDALELGCQRFLFLEGGKIKPVLVNGQKQNELPRFDGISLSDLESARDGQNIEIAKDKLIPSPQIPESIRPAPKRKIFAATGLLCWHLHAVLKDIFSPRSRLFVLVIGVVSFFAALSYCFTSGLAGATVTQLKSAIENEPDFRNITVMRRPLAGSPDISHEERRKLGQIAGVEGVYSMDAPGLLIHWDGQNPLSGLSGRCLEPNDAEAKRFSLYYSVPKTGDARFCCGIVLCQRAFSQAQQAGAIRVDDRGNQTLMVYKTRENEKRQKLIDEQLELPIIGVHSDKDLPYADFLLPWEFGLAYGGRLGAPWHRSWGLLFARPDGRALRPSHRRVTLLKFHCLGLPAKQKVQVQTAAANVARAFALGKVKVFWNAGMAAFIIDMDIPPGRDVWEEAIKKILHFLHQTLPNGALVEPKCIMQNMELKPFPKKKLATFEPGRLSVYVKTLEDLWPVMQKIASGSLYPKSRHLRSLAILKSIGDILSTLLWVTLGLFSFFGVVAIGSSSIALVERNRGEIGISLGFGSSPARILSHYLAVGFLTTMFFGILAVLTATLLKNTVIVPIIKKISEDLGIPFFFYMGTYDYLLAVFVPIAVTIVAIAIPTIWNMLLSPATLLRSRVS